MSSNLDKLVNNLEPDQFKNLKEQFNDIELLVRKGVFPYDWFNFNLFVYSRHEVHSMNTHTLQNAG